MRGVTILGATGSIGTSTLDVLSRYHERFRVVALTAHHQVDKMVQACIAHQPRYAVMADADAAEQLRGHLARHCPDVQVLAGSAALEQVAALADVDYVMAAIVGAAGLRPTLAAARAGKRVLLANKEALVMSGRLFMDEVQKSGAELLPIDSEHNAVFQCMPRDFSRGLDQTGVRRILLTASGGPFRNQPLSELDHVTPEQACAHPNWVMGRKISVDSATMMNKGLEVIEACWLFHAAPEQVQVVLHPQSVIHSMVEYLDGSVLAQLANPDMRIPIAYALSWPERMASGVASLNIFEVARLDFEPPSLERFPCLRLAYEAIRLNGTAPAVLNAANEVAVAAFLERRLAFVDIPRLIEHVMSQVSVKPANSLEAILAEDHLARQMAQAYLKTNTTAVL
ncbi:MAG: 1-deoxy-D-xylulose-5-phosphate reductoisomerase [Gammaproteobacteria bacterium RBG_16_57_12]|nr:MAG: 1-deoxy-D-xylulose-5-phosphate reductoisomerase [Gammaproteobacteria bacterium RBG_16_57_12]